MTEVRPGIDHLVIAAQDLEAARVRFARFGFTLTPPARHPFGTGNSLAQLQGNFIELLAVVEPEKLVPMRAGHFSFSAFNAGFLEKREGLSTLVLTSSDAEATNAAWAARGLRTFEPVHFSRQARQPDGGTATVAFTIAFAVDPAMPEAAFFVCQQHTPEAFWQPRYQVHANTARAVVGVTMVAAEPAAHAGFFGRLVGPEAVTAGEGRLDVALEGGRLEVLTEDALAKRFRTARALAGATGTAFVAASLAVEDPDAARRTLAAAEVPVTERDGALEIGPDQAGGLTLELLAGV